MQGITKKSPSNNKTRKKTSFKKHTGKGHKNEVKKSTRKQENLHKLFPTLLVQVGDRVRVKGKYNGIVKYLGRLEATSKQPDIYVGVHLDEPVTKSSGVFKNRQYFDCPFGYGMMIPYNQVQKINRVKKLIPAMEPPNSLERTNEPYSIKRWKSATDISELDLDLLEPEPTFQTKTKRMIKEKSATDPRDKKFVVPELLELSPTAARKQDRELSGMLNMWSSRYDNPNMLRDICQPNPYPSSSALQQSFAMICDTYSSSDSGFGEAYSLANDRATTLDDKHHHRGNINNYRSDDSTYFSTKSIPRDNASGISMSRLIANNNRTRSLPRNITAYNDDENDSTDQFIQARRTFPKTPRETFDDEGYYISKGAVQVIKPANSEITSPEKSPIFAKSLASSQFTEPIVGSDYNATYLPRETAHTIINVDGNKRQRGRSKRTRNRDVYSNSLQRASRNNRQQKTMVRAKSVGEGLGGMKKKTDNILKSDLIEWRKKFGDVHANGMLTGLQKLQVAFVKGMNLKETYGYPTRDGRYIKVAK